MLSDAAKKRVREIVGCIPAGRIYRPDVGVKEEDLVIFAERVIERWEAGRGKGPSMAVHDGGETDG